MSILWISESMLKLSIDHSLPFVMAVVEYLGPEANCKKHQQGLKFGNCSPNSVEGSWGPDFWSDLLAARFVLCWYCYSDCFNIGNCTLLWITVMNTYWSSLLSDDDELEDELAAFASWWGLSSCRTLSEKTSCNCDGTKSESPVESWQCFQCCLLISPDKSIEERM